MIYNRLTISILLATRRFKRRSSDATKIRCFFYLCKSFRIVLIISHLSIPFAFCTESKNPVSKDERLLVNIAFTAGGITGMLGFVCICLAELRRI